MEGASVFLLMILTGMSAADTRPNIVFILADDLGWNDVSWHNHDVVSPNLQSLVDSGVMLEQSYVQPLCTPSRAAFMTGLYPYRLGREGVPIFNSSPTGLSLNHTLLPQHLKDLGYSTHMVGKWHLGFCNWSYVPTRRGFESFYGFYGGGENHFDHTYKDGYDFRDNEDVDLSANNTYATHLHTERAINIIEAQQDTSRPFFLYLALQNVHSPYEVPDEYLSYYPEDMDPDRRLYLAMVTAIDVAVGRVMAALKDTGLYDNTVVVFSSDNGGVKQTNLPLRGKKGTLWEGGTRAAGFVHSPLLGATPRVHQGLIHITDWHNTFLAIAGAAQPSPSNDGFNQWPSLSDPTIPSPRTSLVYNLDIRYNHTLKGAVRSGQYKLVNFNSLSEDDAQWLTDLEADPNERTNLANELPGVVRELEEVMLVEEQNIVPRDEPVMSADADPTLWGGVWSPGWC